MYGFVATIAKIWVLEYYPIFNDRLKVRSAPSGNLGETGVNGQADFGKKVQATISRNGDLIYRMYLQATLPEV